jgi:Flp pilus assembly protein TadG
MTLWGRDAGGVSIMFAIGLTAVMMILGLSVDGGGQIREVQQADDIASEAARAGGQQIDVADAIAGNPTVLDRSAARAAVGSYLGQAAQAGGLSIDTYTVTFPDAQHIDVTVKLEYHTAILGFMGINSLSATGSGAATLVLA